MIGKVTWSHVDGPRTAILRDDRTWECDLPGEAAQLAEHYNRVDWPTGPSRGRPGHAALNDLAARRRGTVWFEPKPEMPPGTVY